MPLIRNNVAPLGTPVNGPVARRPIDVHPPAWHNDAACTGLSHIFDDDDQVGRRARTGKEAAEDRERTAHARAICHSCPVRIDCLADAFDTESYWQSSGVRGALTSRERAGMMRLAGKGKAIRCTVHCLTELHPGQVHGAWLQQIGLPTGGRS